MRLPRTRIRRGRVEIIPMIDTILILLIFYMSFSSFKSTEKSIEAKLPVVSSRLPPTKVALDVSLHVRDRAHIIVNNGAVYDAVSLRDVMSQLGMIGQEVTVIIGADPGTDYQAVIAALDACAQANLKRVAFRPLPDRK